MTKRIFRSILLVACAAALACVAILLGILYDYFGGVQKSNLRAQTALAAQGVEQEGAAYFDGLETQGCRLTWVAADGTVLYDTQANPEAMANHADRAEIAQALETGTGESERTSATLAEKTLYRAQKLSDGTVLRLSTNQYTVLTLVLGLLQPMGVVLVLVIVLAIVLANRLSKRIVGPLNQLDLEHPLDNDAYEELSPLLTRISQQHRQISSQLEQLRRRQDEFSAVTDSMGEGLILLNESGQILSINPAAVRLFHAQGNCIGQDILEVDRSLPMQQLVRQAASGQSAQTTMELEGGVYQVNASPVNSDGQTAGVCILAFDITQNAQAELQRQEFSANVSHELKTPLQSIMGSAELLENGLVKPEDQSRFIGRIRSEAARMVVLIADIIRLSQLDEGQAPAPEPLELTQLCQEAVDTLSQQAAQQGVTVTVTGDKVPMTSVRRLVYEIVFNLCDNAIRYNTPGGKVTVETAWENGAALLTVTDTGIGIPKEAQSRVFERFYRVDKSHSRETGGTGLGLSIVKHAAQQLGASICLDSAPGTGTRIQLRFPE